MRWSRPCVLSMARKHDVANSAGSQFLICLEDQPQLDGIYTVFGRVLLGMDDVVAKLQVGSKIGSLRVLTKRTHEYKPEKIEQ